MNCQDRFRTHQKRILLSAALLVIAAMPLFGQNEDLLKNYFEGKRVELKIDMPATEKGVDVYPRRQLPVNYEEYGKRLKEFGTAIYIGDMIMITKVRTKGKHIEFQLGGGGYGTFWDESSDVSVPYEDKSQREKDLEKQIKKETDSAKKKDMQDELDDLRDERERENRRLRADAEQRSIQKEQQIRDKATAAGSRFNIRHDEKITGREMTPEYILAALAEFVYFPPETFGDNPSATVADAPEAPSGTGGLQKGMLWDDIAAQFGMPKSVNEVQETMTVTKAKFEKGDQIITAKFVNGVLVQYSISSK